MRFRSKTTITQNNIRNLYGDVAAFGVINGIAGTFLSVFALRMGATNQDIGLLTALPALIYVLWFVPAGRLVESRRSIKAVGLVGVFLTRLQFALIALIPFLPAAYRVPVLLLIITMAAFPLCVANVALTNVLADVVPPANRPRVMSVRAILVSLTSAVAAAGAGKLLDMLPMPGNYQVLFAIAFVFGLLSTYYLSQLVVAQTHTVSSFSLQPHLFIQQIREIVAIAWGAPAFLRFTLAAFVMHWALVFAWPLFALWWVRGLQATEGLLGIVATINLTMTVLISPFWARVAERRGNHFVLMAGFAGVAIIPLMNYFLPSPEYIMLTEAFGGLVLPAMSLGLFNSMLDVAPVDRRPAYIAFYSAAVNVPMFLAPLLATSIAVPLFGVRLALGLSTGLRIVAWLIMFALLRKKS